MSIGSGATTIYDVVTRYRVEDGASTPLDSLGRRAHTADLATRNLGSSLVGVGRSLMSVATMAGSLAGVTSGAAAIGLTFRNINQEMNATIATAAQLNLAFEFDPDPARSYLAAMGSARTLVGEITRDAAALPGELSDFMQAMSTITLPVLTAGRGTTADVRSLLQNLSIAAPMAQQSMGEAGRQVMRMMTGQVSIGDNPLFATLFASGLLPNAETLNRLPGPQKLHAISNALEQLAGNPALRGAVLRTFDTQLSTLKDNLFGVEGVMGQLLKGPANDFLDWLVRLNQTLAERKGDIVQTVNSLTNPTGLTSGQREAILGPPVPGSGWSVGDLAARAWDSGMGVMKKNQTELLAWDSARREYERTLLGAGKALPWSEWSQLSIGVHPNEQFTRIYENKLNLIKAVQSGVIDDMVKDVIFQGREPGSDVEPKRRAGGSPPKAAITKQIVTQNIQIKVDLKSDDSPEAIAAKLADGVRRASIFPRRSARAVKVDPGPSGVN